LAELSNVVPTNQKRRLDFGLVKSGEFREPPYGTTSEPSLPRNRFEGATTRAHDPDRIMKPVHQKSMLVEAPDTQRWVKI
jgi:hypothetical protein